MADMDNFSEINENFDTIKTLLNSIRAQGILNTSDVDKLLTGINMKLEKINTDEDIDLIKIFLSELKQNLDERHSVLVSKFGAIESLFSNLLKNSSEMPKSADIKELFDIVATNLSVFSREVVSQKETLTDITLRLDAMRSDDTQKKDIIKNITLLKPDLERLNNGFDSIVISLNDNFKTIIKTITTIDKTEYLEKFADSLNSMEMSSNTVLSALQMLDKKTEKVDESLKTLATKDDITSSNQRLFELTAQSHELTAAVNDLSDRYLRIDSLADKIDASVNIIASLKSIFEEADDKRTNMLLEQLRGLEHQLETISSDSKFEDFKVALTEVLKGISENYSVLDEKILASSQEIERIISILNSLDINVNFQNILSVVNKVETDLKSSINEVSQRIINLQDANVTRILNDISSEAETLGSKINQTQAALAVLCEKNFASVFENVSDLRNLLSQLDENTVSANNAIFSSITDRLTLFENSLRESLDTQESTLNHSSAQLAEQIDNIKNISSVLDYKMDSSAIEFTNIKKEFDSLKMAVEGVLALDFVNVVKDLRVDLYASKQELVNTQDANNNDLADKLANDLYSKYELLISKIDAAEDEFKKSQADSLIDLKSILDKISSSIVDVISYVSEKNTATTDDFESKLAGITNLIKENTMDYVESVRDVVDVIRIQVENNLKNINDENLKNIDTIKKSISENSEDLKKEIKYSYSKLLEIQDAYGEIKELLNINETNSTNKIEALLSSSDTLRADFDTKLALLKNGLFEKIADFKQEFTCENADKVSEIKFSVENLYNKNSQDILTLVNELKTQMKELAIEDSEKRDTALSQILDKFINLKDLMNNLNEQTSVNLTEKVDSILDDFASVKSILGKVDENIDSDMTRQLSIIESNFESLVSQMSILFDKSDRALSDKINEEFSNVSEKMQDLINEKLDSYKLKIEETFSGLEAKSQEQSKYMQERIADLNTALKSLWDEQSEDNIKHLEEISESLKSVIDENVKMTAADYVSLKNKLIEFAKNIEENNENLALGLKSHLDDAVKYIDTSVETFSNEQKEAISSVNSEISALTLNTGEANNKLTELSDTLELTKNQIQACKEAIVDYVKKELDYVSGNIEKETDAVIAELVEQFDILKKTQSDEIIELTTRIEEIVNSHIYNNVEDLKSYLDIKTDNSVLVSKLDNLKLEITESFDNVVNDMTKLLDSNIFSSTMSDFRAAGELLLNSTTERLENKISNFVKENGEELISKLAFFDEKFSETVADKFEEIKILSNGYKETFDKIQISIENIVSEFVAVKADMAGKIEDLADLIQSSSELTAKEVRALAESFENLRSQISNKSFDEAFQASINKQISGLEALVSEQMTYIEEINNLCSNNLPELAEIKSTVNDSIISSIQDLADRINETDIASELEQVKTDIITQFLNIFNQISFEAEQEEILDFIQEKHDELITILSHIVTTSADVNFVKDEIISVDNKIDTIKEDIKLINNKITSIISSSGDVDYIYSLQDLESDIANLRLVLNEMKENDHSNEFSSLISSTNEIYSLVETIKSDLPTKTDIENIAEDIVSISTRTNKLILASDESYKTLQDNLQDFKLVINDLDERTRNFAQESGIDRLDSKLNAINTMVTSGAKSTQVFNQVFEYLAEWVDNASVQINSISDRVESLDEISQIKTMIADLKAETADNSESIELIEALSSVFDKQAKKISSLETKLDKIIVETTINNKLDLSPIEETLNKFLVAMDEKFSSQQAKINMLEENLKNVLNILDEKDTAQLTKKIGSVDRQVAKLNKSIEKITAHVTEK